MILTSQQITDVEKWIENGCRFTRDIQEFEASIRDHYREQMGEDGEWGPHSEAVIYGLYDCLPCADEDPPEWRGAGAR